jgi:hypothetical protein
LGAIIERISGQSYEAFLHHEILKPLKMFNSGYGRREARHPDRATGYTEENFGQATEALPIDFSVLHSSGALYSTIDDMLKWDKSLYTNQILSQKHINKMMIPYISNYGYGWFLEKRFGHLNAYHEGIIDGYNTYISRWPEIGLCIIVFSNDDMSPIDVIGRNLASICFAFNGQLPMPKNAVVLNRKIISEYIGVYSDGQGNYRVISGANNVLHTRILGKHKVNILPSARDSLFFENDHTHLLIFDRDSDDKIISLHEYTGGQVIEYYRLSDEQAEQFLINKNEIVLDTLAIDRYCGRYMLESAFSDSTHDFILFVDREGDKLKVQITETECVELIPNSKSTFFHKDADLQLSFLRDDLGQIEGCILSLGLAEIYGKKIP